MVPEYKPAASLAFFGAFLANRPFLEYAGREAERPQFATPQLNMNDSAEPPGQTIDGGYFLSIVFGTTVGVVVGWCCGRRTVPQITSKKGYAPVETE